MLAALLAGMLAGCSAPKYEQAENVTGEAGTRQGGFSSVADMAGAPEQVDPELPHSTPYDGQEQKLVHTANLSVESLEFDAAVKTVLALTEQAGGFVQDSTLEGRTVFAPDGVSRVLVDRWASYQLRIPSSSYQSFLDQAGEIGNTVSTRTSVEDISTQYYDSQSRLTAYEVQYDRLLVLLERAEQMEDILLLEERLNEVRYNMESLTTRLRGWQNQVDYSTVHLDLREVSRYTPQAQQGFLNRLGSAATRSMSGFVSFLQHLAIVLVSALPYLLLIGAVAWLALRVAAKKGLSLRRKRENIPPEDMQ